MSTVLDFLRLIAPILVGIALTGIIIVVDMIANQVRRPHMATSHHHRPAQLPSGLGRAGLVGTSAPAALKGLAAPQQNPYIPIAPTTPRNTPMLDADQINAREFSPP